MGNNNKIAVNIRSRWDQWIFCFVLRTGKWLLGLGLLLNLQCCLAYSVKDLLLEQGYSAIPLQRAAYQDTLLVTLTFADDKPNIFILDTGSAVTGIDKRVVEQNHFAKVAGSIITGGVGGSGHTSPRVLMPMLRIDDITSHNELAIVSDYSFISIDKEHIAGLLGLDFLRKHKAVIDIEQQLLYLKPSNKTTNAEKLTNSLLSQGYSQIRLIQLPSRHQALQVQFDKVNPVLFILDTGVWQSLLSLDYAHKLGLKQNSTTSFGRGSSNGALTIFYTKVPDITIGSNRWPSHMMAVSSGFESVRLNTAVLGIIGLDWMREHHVIIDTEGNLLYQK